MARIIHIGFPKTGTTYLQQEVFPKIDSLNYVDFYTCSKIFKELLYVDKLDYNQKDTNARILEHESEGMSTLLSLESLVGIPYLYSGLNRSLAAERLKDLSFDKVIITVRNQKSIIESLYNQYVYQGGVVGFRTFLYSDKTNNRALGPFTLNYLKYDQLIKNYISLFGEKNVLVLVYEELKNDRTKFESDILNFLGHSKASSDSNTKNKIKNPSLSVFSTNLIRILNPYLYNMFSPRQIISKSISSKNLKKLFQVILDPYLFKYISSKNIAMSKEDISYINSFYAESNKELSKLLKRDLAEFGY